MSDFKKKRIKRKKRNRIIAIIFAFFLIAYIILQYSIVQNSKIETIEAMEGYINDSYITSGIVLREETVLKADFVGEIDFIVNEGQRVSSGERVADVYPNVVDINNVSKLNSAIDLKAELEAVSENQTPSSSELSIAYRNLMDNVVELSELQSSNMYSNISNEIIDVSVNMNKLYMATDEITDLSPALTSVSNEISNLTNNISPISQSLYATVAGYFIESTDGYETVASVENFLSMELQQGKDLISKSTEHTPSENEYGKIVTDYRWYIAAYVPSEVFQRLSVGEKISVSIGNNEEIQTCVITNLEKKGDEYILILESMEDAQNAEIERIVDLEIVFTQYSGVKIPKDALRLIDGQLGVYINDSEIAKFKKIDPIYENEDYFILPLDPEENNYNKWKEFI